MERKPEINEYNDNITVTYEGKIPANQLILLEVWLALWTICGLYVFYEYLFANYSKELKLILFIYLIFWAYYFWKIFRVLMYRLRGYEKWIIDEKGFLYIFHNGLKSKSIRISPEENIHFELLTDKVGNFSKSILGGFWSISPKSIGIQRFGKWIEMGIQLPEEQAKFLVKKFNYFFKKQRKKQF